MLSRKEFFDLMDAVYQETTQEIVPPDVHPCRECSARDWDPEYCRGCADFDMCPGLQPLGPELMRDLGKEPGFRVFFRWLCGR